MSRVQPFTGDWKITWWSVRTVTAQGLPPDGFVAGETLKVTPSLTGDGCHFHWTDADKAGCHMHLPLEGGKLNGSAVAVQFGGQTFTCGSATVYELATASGDLTMLVGFLNDAEGFGTGNAGAFIAQAGPNGSPWRRRLARWILGR